MSMNIFGETPGGIILLDFILLAMGLVLSPLLWGIFKRLGDVGLHIKSNVELQTQILSSLTRVLQEQNDARVRDKGLEGRMRALNDKFESYVREKRHG